MLSKPLLVLHLLIDTSWLFWERLFLNDRLQVRLLANIDEVDPENVAFALHTGIYQFRVMPFDLVNVPDILQQLTIIMSSKMEVLAMVSILTT